MTRAITALRSHAQASVWARLADRFRGRRDLPRMHGAPVADLQDDDGRDIADALRDVREPDWDVAAAAAMRPESPPYRGQTLVDVAAHAPRRFVPPGAVHHEDGPGARVLAPLPPERPRPAPLPADAPDRLARIAYPPPGASPEQYAAVMCQFSGATGTATPYQQPLWWGGKARRPVTPLDAALIAAAGDGLHRPALPARPARLALEAPALPDLRVAGRMTAVVVPGSVIL